jgi:thioredoxin-related protein
METFIILIIIAIFIGWIILAYLSSCTHKWEVIDKYEIVRNRDNKVVGITHICQCSHCKKLKSEKTKFF